MPVLIATLATVAGILIVGVGGGLVRPMTQRWDRWLDRAESESQVIRERAKAYAADRRELARQESDHAAAERTEVLSRTGGSPAMAGAPVAAQVDETGFADASATQVIPPIPGGRTGPPSMGQTYQSGNAAHGATPEAATSDAMPVPASSTAAPAPASSTTKADLAPANVAADDPAADDAAAPPSPDEADTAAGTGASVSSIEETQRIDPQKRSGR